MIGHNGGDDIDQDGPVDMLPALTWLTLFMLRNHISREMFQ